MTPPSPTSGSSRPLRVLGDYAILGELGHGASGIVYQAIQLRLNRPVALKILRGGATGDASLRQRFLCEAEAAAALVHPHVVTIYETGVIDGEWYLSMEPLEGGALAERLVGRALDPQDAARLARELADAVQYAHARGILHRDIKPANVLLDAHDAAHLGDFGIAKILASARNETASTEVLGTPAYLAPEVANQGSRAATTASDVYSLGAVLYEMLAGRPPHAGTDPLDVLRRAGSETIVPPSQARRAAPIGATDPPEVQASGIPRDLETICLRCLEPGPEHRYPSAAALVQDLDRFLRGEPVEARPVSTLERSVRWCRRHPGRAALATAAITGVLAGLAGMAWQWRRAENLADRFRDAYLGQKRLHIEQLLDRNDVASGLAHLASILQEAPNHPANARLALSVLAAHDFPLPVLPPLLHPEPVIQAAFLPGDSELFTVAGPRIRFWNTSHGQRVRELVAEAPLRKVVAHPDGKRFLALAADDTATVWSLPDGMPTFHVRLDQPIAAADWLGASNGCFLLGRQGRLRHVDAAGRPVSADQHWDGTWQAASSHPDGSLLAGIDDQGRVRFRSLHDGQETGSALAPRGRAEDLVFSPSGELLLTLGRERGSANVFAVRTRRRLDPQPLDVRFLDAAAFSPDGLRVAGVAGGLAAATWELVPHRRASEWIRHGDRIRSIAYSHDGTRLVTASDDRTAVVWTAVAGDLQPLVLTASGPVREIAFGPDDRVLEATREDGQRFRWEITRGTPLPVESGSTNRAPAPRHVANSVDGRWHAAVRGEDRVEVTDARRPGAASRTLWIGNRIHRIAFEPAGDYLVAALASGGLRTYEMEMLLPATEPWHVNRDLTDMVLSRDGRWVASSHDDGAIRLWPTLRAPDGPATHAFIRMVAAVGGQEHRAGGTVRTVTPTELFQVRSELLADPGDGPEREFIRWFLGDRISRPFAPGGGTSTRDNLTSTIASGFQAFPVRSIGAWPEHPALLRRIAAVAERERRLPASEVAWLRRRADARDSR